MADATPTLCVSPKLMLGGAECHIKYIVCIISAVISYYGGRKVGTGAGGKSAGGQGGGGDNGHKQILE